MHLAKKMFLVADKNPGRVATTTAGILMMMAASASLAGPPGAVGDLYICSDRTNVVIQVDSLTGEVVGNFASTGLSKPFDARFGPNGNLFVVNLGAENVTEHNGNTGELIGIFASTGMNGPSGLRFRPNGHLLVFNGSSKDIMEYDSSGNLLGTFVSELNGDAAPLDFGPDGNLYVSDFGDSLIQRFSPDGTDLGVFASGGSLINAESHVFGPNGNLFVASFGGNTVVEFDGSTGALIGDFINTNLDQPTGLAFAPDGNIWVANWNVGYAVDINQFDGKTGEWMRKVPGFHGPVSITVKPAASSDCLTLTVSTLTAGQNATWDVSGATPAARVAVVYGLKPGQTNITNQLGFCATFGINGVNQNRLVGMKTADGNGNASVTKKIPAGVGGLSILTQAAEQNTCPNECVSNLDSQVIQ